MTTRLCLVRHGETDWNAERRLQGSIDIPLNAAGIQQAQATAAGLAKLAFSAVYSSRLERARATAEIIAARAGLPVILDARLAERNFGELEGWTQQQASERFPASHSKVRAREPAFRPPGGESLIDLAERVSAALADIAKAHTTGTVLCVAHGGVLDIAYRIATDKPLSEQRDFVIGNATINWLSHDGKRWHLESWDGREHLGRAIDELPI